MIKEKTTIKMEKHKFQEEDEEYKDLEKLIELGKERLRGQLYLNFWGE